MKVTDNRAKVMKKACELEYGEAFVTQLGTVYIVVGCEYSVEGYDDEILAMSTLDGVVYGIDCEKEVEPLNVEITIV